MLALKERIVEDLIRAQIHRIEELTQIQKSTQDGAFHEDNKAEGSKDMRATEVSYLARGLAQRVENAKADLTQLRVLKLREFDDTMAVGVSALVEVEDEETEIRKWYFLLPVSSGKHLKVDGKTIYPISLTSPLGQELMGLEVDDDFTLHAPQGLRQLLVTQIQ